MKKRNIIIIILGGIVNIVGLALVSVAFLLVWRHVSTDRFAWPGIDVSQYDRSERAYIDYSDFADPPTFYTLDLKGPYASIREEHTSSTIDGIKNPPAPDLYKVVLPDAILGRVWTVLNHFNDAFKFNNHQEYGFYYITDIDHYCHPKIDARNLCYEMDTYLYLLLANLTAYASERQNEQETVLDLDNLIDDIEEDGRL